MTCQIRQSSRHKFLLCVGRETGNTAHLTLTSYCSCSCASLDGGSRNCQSWIQKDHQGTWRKSYQTRQEIQKKFWHAGLYHREIPNTTSLFFNYVTLYGPFPMFIFRPNTGNFSATTKITYPDRGIRFLTCIHIKFTSVDPIRKKSAKSVPVLIDHLSPVSGGPLNVNECLAHNYTMSNIFNNT